ncbi:hypothetical protein BU17DRAFT_48940 [Hysterangium stoloniferum]|nr:hypothetical protein BU17DRAFT_48940 [Hysterangium stoloniferum]
MAIISPPDAVCIAEAFFPSFEFKDNMCPITDSMVTFLNLTSPNGSTLDHYFSAYCAVSPPDDDGCPYGFCPNTDIGGPLVRISALYNQLSAWCVPDTVIKPFLCLLLTATIIFSSDDIPKDAIWSQILTAYSLLITSAISIRQKQLTRIHANIAVATAGSPSSAYIVAYAIRSIWQDNHRMKTVFAKDNILHRVIAIALLPIWIALAAYTMFPRQSTHFSQISCEDTYQRKVFNGFLFLPVLLFVDYQKADGSTRSRTLLRSILWGLPVELTVLSWIIAIWLSRSDIWKGERYKIRFRDVWDTVTYKYPFILFVSVVVLPSVYWIALIELGALLSNDDTWEPTFGQVLAIFVAVPPIIEVLGRAKQCKEWFLNLTWVCLLTGQSQPPRGLSTSSMALMDAPEHQHPQRMSYTEVPPGDSSMEDRA